MAFEFTSRKGNKVQIEATATAEIIRPDYSEDDMIQHLGAPEVMFTGTVVLFVDGKKIYRSNTATPQEWKVRTVVKGQENFFKLPVGTKYIEIGSKKIVLPDDETAVRYTAWLNEVIEAAKTPEVKEFLHKEEIRELHMEIAEAQRAKDTGHFVATETEAKARRKALTDWAAEESTLGFEPIVYSAEKLAEVESRLAKLEQE